MKFLPEDEDEDWYGWAQHALVALISTVKSPVAFRKPLWWLLWSLMVVLWKCSLHGEINCFTVDLWYRQAYKINTQTICLRRTFHTHHRNRNKSNFYKKKFGILQIEEIKFENLEEKLKEGSRISSKQKKIESTRIKF